MIRKDFDLQNSLGKGDGIFSSNFEEDNLDQMFEEDDTTGFGKLAFEDENNSIKNSPFYSEPRVNNNGGRNDGLEDAGMMDGNEFDEGRRMMGLGNNNSASGIGFRGGDSSKDKERGTRNVNQMMPPPPPSNNPQPNRAGPPMPGPPQFGFPGTGRGRFPPLRTNVQDFSFGNNNNQSHNNNNPFSGPRRGGMNNVRTNGAPLTQLFRRHSVMGPESYRIQPSNNNGYFGGGGQPRNFMQPRSMRPPMHQANNQTRNNNNEMGFERKQPPPMNFLFRQQYDQSRMVMNDEDDDDDNEDLIGNEVFKSDIRPLQPMMNNNNNNNNMSMGPPPGPQQQQNFMSPPPHQQPPADVQRNVNNNNNNNNNFSSVPLVPQPGKVLNIQKESEDFVQYVRAGFHRLSNEELSNPKILSAIYAGYLMTRRMSAPNPRIISEFQIPNHIRKKSKYHRMHSPNNQPQTANNNNKNDRTFLHQIQHPKPFNNNNNQTNFFPRNNSNNNNNTSRHPTEPLTNYNFQGGFPQPQFPKLHDTVEESVILKNPNPTAKRGRNKGSGNNNNRVGGSQIIRNPNHRNDGRGMNRGGGGARRDSATAQYLCCLTDCPNRVCNRTRFCLKGQYSAKSGFINAGLDKICDQCYFRDRYKFKKQKKENQKRDVNIDNNNNDDDDILGGGGDEDILLE